MARVLAEAGPALNDPGLNDSGLSDPGPKDPGPSDPAGHEAGPDVRLLGATDIRRLAEQGGVRPTKQRGQNFVIDGNTVRRIVRVSGIGPDDVVVEIGPGLGSLTLALADVARRVVAVEVDEALAAMLPATLAERAPGRDVEVVLADALRIESLPGPAPTALVANLPYNISVPVLLHVMHRFESIMLGLVMVQAEVAHRLAAGPGSRTYGVPSVKAAWYGSVEAAGTVGRRVFWPEPNVDSELVSFRRRETPLGDDELRRRTFAVVDAAFAQRRKTLRAALSALMGSGDAAEGVLRAAQIDPRTRGEQLTVHDFVAVAEAFAASGITAAGPSVRPAD